MHMTRPQRGRLDNAATVPVAIAGKAFQADRTGALYWPAERMLIVADLHLEKASGHAARGTMLPPYDTAATLERLADAIERHDPAAVACLGDSLHDPAGAHRISDRDRRALSIMQEGRRWLWVRGNHDPEIDAALGGVVVDNLIIAGLRLCHEPSAARTTHEIAGHLHPAARVSIYGHSIRRPCFIGNGLRLVLPAFGAFTGGLNILDETFLPLFGSDGFDVWLLGEEGVYPVAGRNLRGD